MKVSVVADIIDAVYTNGKFQTSSKKLDFDDFYQFAMASAGSIIRKTFYEERALNNGDVTSFIASMVELKPVKITKGPLGVQIIDEEVLTIPKNLGVFNIYPVINFNSEEDCEIDYRNPFIRIQPGTISHYDREDTGLNYFSQRGTRPVMWCDDVDHVAVEGIFKSGDLDVPENIAREIINDVLGTVLKVAGWPADMTDNGNPNVQMINEKIASAQAA
jgi:hypothetical protein